MPRLQVDGSFSSDFGAGKGAWTFFVLDRGCWSCRLRNGVRLHLGRENDTVDDWRNVQKITKIEISGMYGRNILEQQIYHQLASSLWSCNSRTFQDFIWVFVFEHRKVSNQNLSPNMQNFASKTMWVFLRKKNRTQTPWGFSKLAQVYFLQASSWLPGERQCALRLGCASKVAS